jgi:group II intron reverse transcriptase/maturase
MQTTDALLDIYQKRGAKGLPLERVYRQLFNAEHFLRAYGKIYRNAGSMTPGSTAETVDGMCLQKIHDIIESLKYERYVWTPVRRMEIPKPNGKTRPLGIPTWSDKLVQEVVRMLLEPYYEQRFSDRSHGFRPGRGCHTALRHVRDKWTGTVWFIEGDIKGCFDNIDHDVLLEIIRRDIHDGRLVTLITGMLKAGYMEDWRYGDSLSGTPQGGIISPLLANVYLNELDRFVENTLIPQYRRGKKRRNNPAYDACYKLIRIAEEQRNIDEVLRLRRERRKLLAGDPRDPGFRRLYYVRYADDFLLGFIGPKSEAEEIRQRLGNFLSQHLRLTLSPEKTLVTHAVDGRARFLGYEISVTREGDLLTETRGANLPVGKKQRKRNTNGKIALLMPGTVTQKYRRRYCKRGKVIHRTELVNESVYTIVQRYQSVLRGLYNFYCMASNVSSHNRLPTIKWVLEVSLTKTLALKLKCKVTDIYRRYGVEVQGFKALQVVIRRPGKDPLIATFGGFSLGRKPEGMGVADFSHQTTWHQHSSNRAEVVKRLLAGRCELCEVRGVPLQVHHIRKLANINRPGRRPRAPWEVRMATLRRKTIVVCKTCHDEIHAGRYDGRKL